MERPSFQSRNYSQGLVSSSSSLLSSPVQNYLSELFLHDENNLTSSPNTANINNTNHMYYQSGSSITSNNNTTNDNNNNNGPPPAKRLKNQASDEGDDEDGSLCLICFAPYDTTGDHRCASLRCGHIFGKACISKWLAKGTDENPATCPQCSSTAVIEDIRVLYTRQIKAIDTAERDRVLRELELVQNSKYQAELEIEMYKIQAQVKDDEIRRLKEQVMQHQQNARQQQQQQQQQQSKSEMSQVALNANNPIPTGSYLSPDGTKQIIWTGPLEWHDKTRGIGPHEILKVQRIIPCQISTNVINGEPELKGDGWPGKLIMQLIPKAVIASLGGHYFRDARTVLFMLQACDALTNLSRLLDSGFAACVHVMGNVKSATKVMILLYSKDRHAYLGFVPNDQVGFVDRIRKVIQRTKTQQVVTRQLGTNSGGSSSSSTSSTSAIVSEYLPNLPNLYQSAPVLQLQTSQQQQQQQQQQPTYLPMQIQSQTHNVELERRRLGIQKTLHTLVNDQQPWSYLPVHNNNTNTTTSTSMNTSYASSSSSSTRNNFLSFPPVLHQPLLTRQTTQNQSPEVVLLD